MSKKKEINLSDFQLSMYANHTRVGLDKLKWTPQARNYIEDAIRDIFRQHDLAKSAGVSVKAETKIPYTLFPMCRKAVERFNEKVKTDFLVLYHKHTPIGVIKENTPVSIPVCPKCGIMVKKQMVMQDPLPLWKKIVKFFFRGAYVIPERWAYECKACGNIGDNPEWTTI